MNTRLWTKNYVLGLVVAVMLSMTLYLLMTSMAIYAVAEFGAGEVLAGMTASIFVIGAVLARLGAGIAVDRLGQRRVLLGSLVVFVVAAASYLVVHDLRLLLAVRFVHGVAFGMAHTAVGAIVQSVIPPSRRAEGTGYYGVSTTLSMALGPLLAVLLVDAERYQWLFGSSTLIAVAALVAALFCTPPIQVVSHSQARPRSPIEPTALPLGTFMLLCGIAFSGVVTFLNTYTGELGLTRASAVFFLVFALVVIVTRPALGRLQDRRGDNVVMYPAIVSFAAGLAVLAVATNGFTVLLAAALLGGGWGTLLSAGQAIVVGRTHISGVGRSLSTYFLLVDIGMGFGPVALGLLLGYVGLGTMYGFLAGLVVTSLFVYMGVHGRRPDAARRPH